jgi:hypothetical protein
MKLLYIAAPYRAKTIVSLQQNIYDAKLMAMYYWNKGYAVICPHLNSANFDGLVPDKEFLAGTKLMLSKCDIIAMHPNWKQSAGCIDEQLYMSWQEKEILYPDWTDVVTILNKLYRER